MISKRNMLIVAAIFYFIGASQLLTFSILWLKNLSNLQVIIDLLIGLILGSIKYFYLFKNLNLKNYNRIINGEKKQNFLHFIKPKTFILILVMIFLGISLRVIINVDRKYLLPVYFAIGVALLFSSINYVKFYIKSKKPHNG